MQPVTLHVWEALVRLVFNPSDESHFDISESFCAVHHNFVQPKYNSTQPPAFELPNFRASLPPPADLKHQTRTRKTHPGFLLYNIAGIHNKFIFPEFLSKVTNSDIFFLAETWLTNEYTLFNRSTEFETIQEFAVKEPGPGRPSGGYIFGFRKQAIRDVNIISKNRFNLIFKIII